MKFCRTEIQAFSYTNIIFLQNIFIKNRNFGQKYEIVVRNRIFGQKQIF